MFQMHDIANSWSFLLCCTLLSVLLGSFAVWQLRRRYPKQKTLIFAFFFLFSFTLPLLGVLLGVWLVLFFKFYRYSDHDIEYKKINTDPFFIEFPKIKRQFGDGAIREMMENDRIPINKRVIALTILSETRSRENIEILKQMLSSPIDELRLQSFSVIDTVETEIHRKIHEEKEQLAHKKNPLGKIIILRSLAFLYWELVYLELSDEALDTFLQKKVEDYCTQVLDYFPDDTKVLVLLGRVYLKRGEDEAARECFERAVEIYGEENRHQAQFIFPYIAEIYYHQRRFPKLKTLLHHSEFLELIPKLKPIREIWAA